MISIYLVKEKDRFAKLVEVGRKRKHWEIESDATGLNFQKMKEEVKEKDKVIDDLEDKIKQFEMMKLDYIESEENLAKLYTLVIIDSLWDPIDPQHEGYTDMQV